MESSSNPAIEERLGYTFSNKDLLELAFIHRSFYNENRDECNGYNERLEFLGDSVLGLVVSGYLYEHLPQQSEGHLSHLRAHLVGAEECASYMRILEVEECLLLGRGEAENVGRGRERILANLFEAIIGAIYLDGGLEQARNFFLNHFREKLQRACSEPMRNWKADLQDYSQKKLQVPPEYRVLSEEGPPHRRVFLVGVFVEDVEMGRGEGYSKKEAEVAAAETALKEIEGRENGKS